MKKCDARTLAAILVLASSINKKFDKYGNEVPVSEHVQTAVDSANALVEELFKEGGAV